jgi:hypothetical protein
MQTIEASVFEAMQGADNRLQYAISPAAPR